MKYSYCPDCGRETGHARRLGWGTFFMGVFTLGLSLFLIPLYPKRCTICGRQMARGSELVPSEASHSAHDQAADTKTCPLCAETVKAAALKCRFCGHEFGSDQ